MRGLVRLRNPLHSAVGTSVFLLCLVNFALTKTLNFRRTMDRYDPVLSRDYEATTYCQPVRATFKWTIQYLLQCRLDRNLNFFGSPVFEFMNARWALMVFPFVQDVIYVNLTKVYSPIPEHEVRYKISLKDYQGKDRYTCEKVFKFVGNGVGESAYHDGLVIPRTELHENAEKLMPDDALTLFCELIGDVSPRHSNIVALPKPRHSSGIQPPNMLLQNLSKDLKAASSGGFSDVKLVVEGRVFPVHRVILAARSPKFAAMFGDGVTDRVNVDNTDADAMEALLKYIYAGEVQKLPLEKTLKLYAAAERYSLRELKQHCIPYLVEDLSLSNFYDTAVMAHLYHDKLLMDAVKSLIGGYLDVIINKEEWKSFKRERPDLAEELIEAAVLSKETRNEIRTLS